MSKAIGKWRFILPLLMIMTLMFGSAVSADGKGTVSEDESTIVTVYIQKDGVLTEIGKDGYEALKKEMEMNRIKLEAEKNKDLDEFALMKRNLQYYYNSYLNDAPIQPRLVTSYTYKYVESGFNNFVERTSLKRRITNPIYNDSANPTSYSMIATVTETWSANINITGSAKIKAVTLGATVGGAWSRTETDTFTINPTISSKRWGWLEFTPYHTNSWGYLTTTQWKTSPMGVIKESETSEWADIYSAKFLGTKRPNGAYIVRESINKPTS